MHDYPDKLGEVLKTSREQAGITVEALAEKVNKSVRYIYRLESGDQKPSYQLLCDLCVSCLYLRILYSSRIDLRMTLNLAIFYGCLVNAMSDPWKWSKQLLKP